MVLSDPPIPPIPSHGLYFKNNILTVAEKSVLGTHSFIPHSKLLASQVLLSCLVLSSSTEQSNRLRVDWSQVQGARHRDVHTTTRISSHLLAETPGSERCSSVRVDVKNMWYGTVNSPLFSPRSLCRHSGQNHQRRELPF